MRRSSLFVQSLLGLQVNLGSRMRHSQILLFILWPPGKDHSSYALERFALQDSAFSLFKQLFLFLYTDFFSMCSACVLSSLVFYIHLDQKARMYQFIFGCCYTVKEYPPFPSRNYIFLFCVFTFGSSLALPAPAHFDSFLDILFSKSIKFLLLPPESLCLYLLEFFLNIYILFCGCLKSWFCFVNVSSTFFMLAVRFLFTALLFSHSPPMQTLPRQSCW